MKCPNCGYEMQGLERRNHVSVPADHAPLSAWAYFGYRLLFSIPIVGFILLIVFSCGGTRNVNLRSYARSYWCTLIIALIIVGVIFLLVGGLSMTSF